MTSTLEPADLDLKVTRKAPKLQRSSPRLLLCAVPPFLSLITIGIAIALMHQPDRKPPLPSWKPSFPPAEVIAKCAPQSGGNVSSHGIAVGSSGCPPVANWLATHTPPPKAPDPTATAREKSLARMGVAEYIAARRAGTVTCEEYVAALVKRVHYYGYMDQFMYFDIYPNQTDAMVAQAKAYDAIAAARGIEAIAPLYGLPFPIKGTVATVDFPSSAGVGVLHTYRATEDAAIIHLLRKANAVLFGKTNVPEFACSLITANYANGRALNPYDHRLVTCGSSGGSASAVAT